MRILKRIKNQKILMVIIIQLIRFLIKFIKIIFCYNYHTNKYKELKSDNIAFEVDVNKEKNVSNFSNVINSNSIKIYFIY